MKPSILHVISTCLSHLPEDMWQARIKLFRDSWAHECVERRGCQWFISKSFMDCSNAYPNERLAFEALEELIDTETRIRTLKSLKVLAKTPQKRISGFFQRNPVTTTAPCPPPWEEECDTYPMTHNLSSLLSNEVGK